LIPNACAPLYKWVHEGNVTFRSKIFRQMSCELVDACPSDEPVKDIDTLQQSFAFALVSSLVLFAQGQRIKAKSKKKTEYGIYPYGIGCGTSNLKFKSVPTAWFATTLAEMYPYVTSDKSAWKELGKKFHHPVTALWPWGAIKRHMSFHTKLRALRIETFKAYVKAGGKFHGTNRRVVTACISIDDDDDDDEEDDFD